MSKQLVARALDWLQEGYVLNRIVIDDYGRLMTRMIFGDQSIAALIRAVDDQYPDGYDEVGGFTAAYRDRDTMTLNSACVKCIGIPGEGHAPDCHRWNTRVALLNLCRDILGERP